MSLQVGMQFPSGNFAQAAHNGLGGIATVTFPQDGNLSLSASLGYSYWGPYTAWYLGPNDSYSSLQVLAGFRYTFSRYSTHPYLSLEVGMNSEDFTRSSSYGATSSVYEISEARFCVVPAFGVIIKMSQTINLDLNFKYNASASEEINGINMPSTFFSLNAGLQFNLY